MQNINNMTETTVFVSDAVLNGEWKISRISRLHGELCRSILAEEPPDVGDGDDRFLWRQKQDIYSSSFSCKNTWEQLLTSEK